MQPPTQWASEAARAWRWDGQDIYHSWEDEEITQNFGQKTWRKVTI